SFLFSCPLLLLFSIILFLQLLLVPPCPTLFPYTTLFRSNSSVSDTGTTLSSTPCQINNGRCLNFSGCKERSTCCNCCKVFSTSFSSNFSSCAALNLSISCCPYCLTFGVPIKTAPAFIHSYCAKAI